MQLVDFADLLQLVEKICNKPVDDNFGQSTCSKSVYNLQQITGQFEPFTDLTKCV